MKLLLFYMFLAVPNCVIAQQDTVFKYLAARQTEEGILLTFIIKGGITCSGVTVQRGTESGGFTPLFEFTGVCGSPVSDESYSYLDTSPVSNTINTYRLELGSLGIFSPEISVHYLDFTNTNVVIGPNPCQQECNLWFENFSSDLHELKIFNTQGSLTGRFETSGNFFKIDASILPSGMYVFIIQRDSKTKSTGRLVIL